MKWKSPWDRAQGQDGMCGILSNVKNTVPLARKSLWWQFHQLYHCHDHVFLTSLPAWPKAVILLSICGWSSGLIECHGSLEVSPMNFPLAPFPLMSVQPVWCPEIIDALKGISDGKRSEEDEMVQDGCRMFWAQLPWRDRGYTRCPISFQGNVSHNVLHSKKSKPQKPFCNPQGKKWHHWIAFQSSFIFHVCWAWIPWCLMLVLL